MNDEIAETIAYIKTEVVKETKIKAYKIMSDRIKLDAIQAGLVVFTVGECTSIVDDVLDDLIKEAISDCESDESYKAFRANQGTVEAYS